MPDALEHLAWHQPALESANLFGLDERDVEAIVRHPSLVVMDPSNAVRDWRTERRTRGDITVVVTYPDGSDPIIWGVYLSLGPTTKTRTSAAGGGGGGYAPKTLAALRKRIIAAGLRIVAGGRHDLVTTKEGVYVASLPRTPSDHRSVPNAWIQIRKKGYDV